MNFYAYFFIVIQIIWLLYITGYRLQCFKLCYVCIWCNLTSIHSTKYIYYIFLTHHVCIYLTRCIHDTWSSIEITWYGFCARYPPVCRCSWESSPRFYFIATSLTNSSRKGIALWKGCIGEICVNVSKFLLNKSHMS